MSLCFVGKYRKVINGLTHFGFCIKEGAKHAKAECIKNGNKTTVPRHNKVKREIVRNICKLLFEKGFDEVEIKKRLD